MDPRKYDNSLSKDLLHCLLLGLWSNRSRSTWKLEFQPYHNRLKANSKFNLKKKVIGREKSIFEFIIVFINNKIFEWQLLPRKTIRKSSKYINTFPTKWIYSLHEQIHSLTYIASTKLEYLNSFHGLSILKRRKLLNYTCTYYILTFRTRI